MGLKMKNFNIMGVHLKIRLLLGGGLDNLQTNFKSEKKKYFSVITKNLNWEILTKNLVNFKRWDGVKDEKF